ncbi:MAG: alpha/beta hydrolase [Bacillota bacterium]
MEEKICIIHSNISLEGVLHTPVQQPHGGVVICHPHPLYGGNMDNNVVLAVVRGITAMGLAALRFNFRGVGNSTGSHDRGIGEQEDARAALGYLDKLYQGQLALGLCGYSFGGMIAFHVAVQEPKVDKVMGISPLLPPSDVLENYGQPKKILSGTNDPYIDAQQLAHAVEKMPPPKQLELVEGMDHSWWGSEARVAQSAGIFFQNLSVKS